MESPDQLVRFAPLLDYAPQPSVGDFSLSRADGMTVIKARPSWKGALGSVLGSLLLAAAVLSFYAVSWLTSSRPAPISSVTVICIGLLLAAAGSYKRVILFLAGHRWEIDLNGITFVGRQATSITKQHFPRAMICDLRVERKRIKNQISFRLGLSIVKPDGNRVVILRRKRAELNFVCQAMRDALNLPDDPMGESHYPKIPRFSRIQRRLLAAGAALTLFPTRIGWDGALMALLCLAGAFAVDFWISRSLSAFDGETTFTLVGFFRAGLTGIAACLILLLARYRLRRATTLIWSAGSLHLSERSLFSPCSVSWNGAKIESIRIEAKPGSRRASLILRLIDGSDSVLINRQTSKEVGLTDATLKIAMTRSKEREPSTAHSSPAAEP